MNDPMTILKADHREAKRMMTALGETDEGAERNTLAAELDRALSLHMSIEEQLVYPLVAEHVGAAHIAAEAGFACDGPYPAFAACAVAKSRTSEAAQLVASIAHAVHGAIGITEEYDLQLYTRRLHEGRMAHGSEVHWNRVLGRLLIECKEPLVTDFVRSI